MTNFRSLGYLTLCGALTLSVAGACSSGDDDDDESVGGHGAGEGGRSGAGSSQGGHAGSSFGGGPGDGGVPSTTAGAGQGGAVGGDSGVGGVGGAGGSAAIAALSDAQILLVVDTLNQGEVEQAYAALPRLSEAAVEAFAQLMVTHHGAARQSVASTAAALEQAPAPSAMQAELKNEAEAEVALLRATPTAGLDAAYVALQVAAHAQALTLLTELMAAADADELATLLATLKATVQQHYDSAQALQGQL